MTELWDSFRQDRLLARQVNERNNTGSTFRLELPTSRTETAQMFWKNHRALFALILQAYLNAPRLWWGCSRGLNRSVLAQHGCSHLLRCAPPAGMRVTACQCMQGCAIQNSPAIGLLKEVGFQRSGAQAPTTSHPRHGAECSRRPGHGRYRGDGALRRGRTAAGPVARAGPWQAGTGFPGAPLARGSD